MTCKIFLSSESQIFWKSVGKEVENDDSNALCFTRKRNNYQKKKQPPEIDYKKVVHGLQLY